MKKKTIKKKKAGGKRKGAGRKPKYSEKTKPVAFKCPTSKVVEFKEHCTKKLKEWEIKNDIHPYDFA